MNIYISERTLRVLKRIAAERGTTVEDLASAAVEEAALQADTFRPCSRCDASQRCDVVGYCLAAASIAAGHG